MYLCPMHPGIRRSQEGLCPECGMRLIPSSAPAPAGADAGAHPAGHHGHDDFDKHKGHATNIFRTKFWVSLALSVPVVLYSDIAEELFGLRAPVFPGSAYTPFVLSSVIFFYGGWVFIASAARELRARMPGMMTLISLAISTAYCYSAYVILTGAGKTLFWELATLISVMLLGHWMEMRAVSGASSALRELSKILPDRAEVMRDGMVRTLSLADLRVGDVALVRPGGKIPADGVVAEGVSDVDESFATGESTPVLKRSGSEVIAGTINGDGALRISVTKIGEETFLAGVMRLVAEAQSSKSRLQVLSDRAAYYLTLIAVVSGGATLVWWLYAADPAFAVERMVAVLVIACPHALGLAVPLVASISTTKAAQNGFLVKRRLALEAARDIDTVLFDKTGTLTRGAFGVDAVISAAPGDEERVLRYAASVNAQSEHPIARATVAEADKRGIALLSASDFQRIAGKGAKAVIDGTDIFVGGQALLSDLNLSPGPAVRDKTEQLGREGKTVVFVMRADAFLGAIALADVIRDESREALAVLRAMGIRTAMITGDAEPVAQWVARELGIDEYAARVLPQDKSEKVREMQARGLKVAMVGDGVNDAPALAQADLGIAIGAGTNVAIESAGIILVKNDPRDIPKIVALSRMTYRKMIQNLWWAAGYNIAALPLAAGVLAFRGIFLQPALAALLMSVSTVVVAANAMLLRGRRL